MIARLTARFSDSTQGYPRQFWLIFWGALISAIGGSMVWPFLTLYIRQRLNLPLTNIAFLLTISSIASLLASFIAGSAADRFGRKSVMSVGLLLATLVLALMTLASNYWSWVFLMIFNGIVNPLYGVGVNAMIADLIPQERRPNAYALLRIIQNLGISFGPAIGGFIAMKSYSAAFYAAAISNALYALIIISFIK